MRKLFLLFILVIGFTSCNDKLWEEIEMIEYVNDSQRKALGYLRAETAALLEQLQDTTAELQALIDANAEGISENTQAIVEANEAILENTDLINANYDELAAADGVIQSELDSLGTAINEQFVDVLETIEDEVEALEAADIALGEAVDQALEDAKEYADANDQVGGYNDSAIQNAIVAINNDINNIEDDVNVLISERKAIVTYTLKYKHTNITTTVTSTFDNISFVDKVATVNVTLPEGTVLYHHLNKKYDFGGLVGYTATVSATAGNNYFEVEFDANELDFHANPDFDLSVFIGYGLFIETEECYGVFSVSLKPTIHLTKDILTEVAITDGTEEVEGYYSVDKFTGSDWLKLYIDEDADISWYTLSNVTIDGVAVDFSKTYYIIGAKETEGTKKISPYTGSNDVTRWNDGVYTVKATLTDACGNTETLTKTQLVGTSASNSGSGKVKKPLVVI